MTSEKTRIILYAEDEPAQAALVRIALQRNADDVQLHHVEDGGIALDYLYRRGAYAEHNVSPRPDLILLDLRMVLIGGLEVLSTIKKDPELQTIPTVILTTSDSEEDRSHAYTSGADGYFTKPMDFDQFVEMIKQMSVRWLQQTAPRP